MLEVRNRIISIKLIKSLGRNFEQKFPRQKNESTNIYIFFELWARKKAWDVPHGRLIGTGNLRYLSHERAANTLMPMRD